MTKYSAITADLKTRATQDASLYALILMHVRDGISVQDLNGRVEWVNPAGEAMFGWSLPDVLGKSVIEFIVPPEMRPAPEEINSFRYDLDSSIFKRFRVDEHIRRDGTRFWNQQSFSVLELGPGEEDKRVVVSCRDVTQQVEADRALQTIQVELEHAAHHDDLTGLANRKRLGAYLESAPMRAALASGAVGALQLDVDRFKEINDSLGHAAGDAALVHVARALRGQTRKGDMACRTGGDEFVLICRNITDQSALMQRAEALRRAIAAPLRWREHTLNVGSSIGVSMPKPEASSGEALIQMADQALYTAKAEGRGRVVHFCAGMARAQKQDARLAQDLQTALERRQFLVHLQPQLRLTDMSVTGFEALLRWSHPAKGLLSPGDFLDVAERSGLLADVDYAAMHASLDALRQLRAAGFGSQSMAINVSSALLADSDYPQKLLAALSARNLRVSDISIEILETAIFQCRGPDMRDAVARLKSVGLRVALDDFGTGYAGLSKLSSFDIDAIKLDHSLIRGLETDTRNRAVVRSIIRLAHILGLETVAEGVETQGQLDILRRTTCPIVQGFGLARPMTVEDTLAWLKGRTAHRHNLKVSPPA